MIRDYVLSDEKTIISLFRANVPEFFDSSEEKELRYYLNHQREDYFVYELNGEVVAAAGINYFPEANEARFSWDFILPAAQKKGIGSALAQHRLEVISKRANVRKVVVRTSQMAHEFYSKMGFKLDFVKNDFWAPGFHLYQMSKPVELR